MLLSYGKVQENLTVHFYGKLDSKVGKNAWALITALKKNGAKSGELWLIASDCY